MSGMQWVASGFLFVRGRSVIHRIDPRVRLFLALGVFVVSLSSHSITELVVVLCAIGILTAVAGIVKRFAKSMLLTVVISVLAFIVNFVLYPTGPVNATIFALRLFAVISSTSVFFLTTTPDELEHVLKWLRIPPDFVMVFVVAVRFVPVLLLDAIQIMDAQRARGLEIDRGNFLHRLKNTVPVLVPLIAVALNRSLDLAEAMDSRAYGAVKRPSTLYTLKLRTPDYLTIIAVSLTSALGMYAAFFLSLF